MAKTRPAGQRSGGMVGLPSDGTGYREGDDHNPPLC